MIRTLLFLFVLWPLACLAGDPVTVSGRVVQGVWIVEGSVNEKPAYFIVDTGANRTGLLPDPSLKLGDCDVSLKIGDFSAKTTAYVSRVDLLDWLKAQVDFSNKPILGILGMDVLLGQAVGFDFSRGEVSFWAGGKLASGVAGDWVGAGFSKLELTKRFGERFGIPVAFGNAKGWCILDSGAADTSLLPRFGKKLGTVLSKTSAVGAGTTDMEMRIIPEATIGSTVTPWLNFGVGSPGEGIPGSPDGVVSLGDLRSSRVLVDLAGASLYYAPAGRSRSLEIALSKLLTCPVVFDEDTLRVGTVGPAFAPGLRTFETCKIISIAGYPVRDVAAALSGTAKDSSKFMIELAKRLQTNFTIVILYQGEPFNLNAHPRG